MSHLKLILLYGVFVFGHVFMSTLMVWAISWVFKDQGYGLFKILTFTFSNDSSKILLIYFFSFLYIKRFYLPTLNSTKEAEENNEKTVSQSNSIEIKNGRQRHFVSFDSILCIRADSPYVLIQTEESSYLHSSSLKKVAEKLDSRFLKLHRSCIVNIDKVTSYQSRLNGDYDVNLCGHMSVRLSRNYAKEFKALMGQSLTT